MRVLINEVTNKQIPNMKFGGVDGFIQAIEAQKELTRSGTRCYLKHLEEEKPRALMNNTYNELYFYYLAKMGDKVVGLHKVTNQHSLKKKALLDCTEITKEEYNERKEVYEEDLKTYVRSRRRERRSFEYDGYYYVARQTRVFKRKDGEEIVSKEQYKEAAEKGIRITSLKIKK